MTLAFWATALRIRAAARRPFSLRLEEEQSCPAAMRTIVGEGLLLRQRVRLAGWLAGWQNGCVGQACLVDSTRLDLVATERDKAVAVQRRARRSQCGGVAERGVDNFFFPCEKWKSSV